ncbi:MAG: type I methionyl aminopeptidase [Candidatus Moranbacteria bacterium]|nr:type I methionyl aminopeptidase [Candidatus Moranbacteria bacterium]
MNIIKTSREIKIMRENGKILASIVSDLEKKVKVGVSGKELDDFAEEQIRSYSAVPSFKNYGEESGDPFPYTICFSLNEEVVHGFPTEKKIIQDGDLVKIDIGLKKNGYHADMARTFCVGEVSQEKKDIMKYVCKSLLAGLKAIKDGAKMSDYSKAVQKYAESKGYSVVRDLVGHGIGQELHESPQIPNYFGKHFYDFELKAGMTLALEPMINEGTFGVKVASDGWTYVTNDGQLSAHWENTILVTKNGCEILTSV